LYNIRLFEIARMMKAAVITSTTEPLEIKQMPIPKVGPNDVLVKNIACGVCHSDLHMAKNGTK
jgi:propanol-preferring alcohol dehydrogenase